MSLPGERGEKGTAQRRWSKDLPPDLSETESGPSYTKDSRLTGKLKINVIHRIQTEKKYLDAKKEKDSKLRRFTIGKKDPTIPNKTILLVGETGAGKSTFIDAMLNHLMGRKYEDHAWCTVMDEAQNQSETQSTAVTAYDIFGFHNENFPYSLTIIDTPGFGDTRGVVEDRQIARMLQSLFKAEDGVKQLDAVGLVLQPGTNRLSDRQNYIFNSVVSLFGKDLEKNIVALITHSSGLTPSNELNALQVANVKMARDENKPIYFLFNNSPNKSLPEISDKEKEKRARKYAWETSQDGMNKFLEFLKKVETRDLKQTADVLTKRIQLEALCNNLKEQIDSIEMKQKEIQQVKGAIEQLDNEAANATTIVEVDEDYKELEYIGGLWDNKATRCTICEENCHYPGCTWAWSLYMCDVMTDGNCTSCPGKCEYYKHVRDEKRYVSKTRKAKKTVEDVQKKCKIGEEKGQKKALLAAIEKDLEVLQKERENLISRIYLCIVNLEDIALNRDSFYTYNHLVFVINTLQGTGGNDEMIQKMIEVKDRMEKESQAIKYATE